MMVRASSPKIVLFRKISKHNITKRRRSLPMTKYQITVLKFDQIILDQICPTKFIFSILDAFSHSRCFIILGKEIQIWKI